jgi:hypothetical protein
MAVGGEQQDFGVVFGYLGASFGLMGEGEYPIYTDSVTLGCRNQRTIRDTLGRLEWCCPPM